MFRFSRLWISFLPLLLLLDLGCQTPERPPNLIILFSDDAGYADFGFHGSELIRTPTWTSWPNQELDFQMGMSPLPFALPPVQV